MAQSPATQWPMTNIFNPWPVYTDGVSNVIAVKIASIMPHTDGSITIVPEGDYNAVYEPQMFVTIFSPDVGGYLVRDSDNQDLYVPSVKFESTYTAVPRGEPGWARAAVSGNMPVNYVDNPGIANAHGKIGSTLYWKTTVVCSKAQKGSDVIASAQLLKTVGVPCDVDGNALPFSIVTNQIPSASSAPSVEIYLLIHGPATKLCSLTNKETTPLRLALGDGGADPSYLLTYWYQKAAS